MPIYAYTCCKSHDVLQKIGAAAPACPACEKPMAKLITPTVGFQLKGGYYKYGFNK